MNWIQEHKTQKYIVPVEDTLVIYKTRKLKVKCYIYLHKESSVDVITSDKIDTEAKIVQKYLH